MGTITWQAGQHRLRLAGRFEEGDRGAVEDALAAIGDPGPVFIVDLTAVDSLDPSVVEILAACERAEGCRVSVLRRSGSEVDRMLSERGA